jgi:hypothetical protein
MRSHLQYFAYSIHSSTLWSSEKRPVQNTQSVSCSSSSSVESSSRRTVNSASKYDGVSDGVGSRKTLLFRLFEGQRRAFDAGRKVLNLVACLIFLFLSCLKIFFEGELVIFFAVPTRGFGFSSGLAQG